MNRLACLLGLMAFAIHLASPRANACPSCQEALKAPNTSQEVAEETDPFREARAYNYSIYLMVGMPYLLLATVGFVIYRAVRQKDRASIQIADLMAGGEVHDPCPAPYREEHS